MTTGFIFFMLWAFTEAAQQALSVLHGVATWQGRGLERVLSVLYFAAAGLTLSYMSETIGGSGMPESIGF
ncbi:MAG: hypothetical protein ACREON_01890 [Gemmatimonadaceae bacterium]